MGEQEARPKGLSYEWLVNRIMLPVIGFCLVTAFCWIVAEIQLSKEAWHRVELSVARIETHLGLHSQVAAIEPKEPIGVIP